MPFFGDRVGSSKGTQQGMPQSMLAFCVAIQPELEALDRELGCVGGCARAIADDVMAVGPAQVVFPAVLHFLSALRESVGLEAQLAKFQCWSSSYDLASCPYRSRAGVPVSFVASPESGARMHGVMVGGVPLGEPASRVRCCDPSALPLLPLFTYTVRHRRWR